MRFMRGLLLLAVFAVVLAAGAPLKAQMVGGLAVEGNDNVSSDRILLTFGVRVGEELSAEDIREGVRRLYGLGHFSDVRVLTESGEGEELNLVVVVEERPRISAVEVRGNDKISKSDIESVLRIQRGIPFEPSALEDSRVAVLGLYESKGFPYAVVEASVEEAPGNAVRVVLAVEEKTRVTVRKIQFDGNEAIDDSDLKKVMETKEDRWWRTNAFLEATVLEEDLKKIVDLYRNDGYIGAKALGYETEYDSTGAKVTVTVRIDEGAVYEVSAVEWMGASDFAVAALYDVTSLEVGETYRPAEAEQTIRDAYGWYGERGYIHARIFRVEDIEDDNKVKISFHVDEAEPARIGQIHIVGNERTKEKVIRRELTVKPGDLYQTSEVIASQRRVANLGFFNGPGVEFAQSRNPNDVDLILTVEERQTGRAGVGISHTSERGITGFLELSEGNLFGNGQYLDLKWEFGKKSTEVVLGFTEPWFLDKPLSVGFDVYDTDDKRVYGSLPIEFYEDAFKDDPNYDEVVNCEDCSRYYVIERERRGGDVRVGWPFLGSRYTKIYAKYTLEQYKYKEYAEINSDVADTNGVVIDTERNDYVRSDPGWEWRSGLTTTVVRRSTDRRFHPRLGSYTRFTADAFGWVFGGDVEYQRYVLDARTYFPAFWNVTLMLRARAGIVTGYGDPSTVPNDTRFEVGGVGLNGIRGYDNRSILPEGKELYGGRTMLLGTAELKLPLTDEREQMPVYGLVFVDAGNTWDSWDETHPSELFWGAGAGIRVEVPILGNIGIDMGYGFDEDEGGEWIVHYQFGFDY
jgi:outer membrane protein insertion porin family